MRGSASDEKKTKSIVALGVSRSWKIQWYGARLCSGKLGRTAKAESCSLDTETSPVAQRRCLLGLGGLGKQRATGGYGVRRLIIDRLSSSTVGKLKTFVMSLGGFCATLIHINIRYVKSLGTGGM